MENRKSGEEIQKDHAHYKSCICVVLWIRCKDAIENYTDYKRDITEDVDSNVDARL